MFATVNGYAYMRGNLNLRWWSVPVLAPLILGAMAVGITKLLLRNVGITYWRDDVLPRYLATIERWKAADPVNASDEQLLDGVRALARVDALYWFAIALAMGTAKSTDVLLDRFLSFAVPGRGLSSARLLRGFGSKVLDAEAELEGIATAIRGSDALRLLVEATPAKRLLDELKRHPNGDSVLEDLNRYFERYGHQIYSLDFAVPTQGEDPLPVLLSLKSLVSSPGRDVRARQAELARERERLAADRARSLGPSGGCSSGGYFARLNASPPTVRSRCSTWAPGGRRCGDVPPGEPSMWLTFYGTRVLAWWDRSTRPDPDSGTSPTSS
jgi:rifampicin phosphotransferase